MTGISKASSAAPARTAGHTRSTIPPRQERYGEPERHLPRDSSVQPPSGSTRRRFPRRGCHSIYIDPGRGLRSPEVQASTERLRWNSCDKKFGAYYKETCLWRSCVCEPWAKIASAISTPPRAPLRLHLGRPFIYARGGTLRCTWGRAWGHTFRHARTGTLNCTWGRALDATFSPRCGKCTSTPSHSCRDTQ